MVKFDLLKFVFHKKSGRHKYRISSNKRRASNNRRVLIKAAPLGIRIEISALLE